MQNEIKKEADVNLYEVGYLVVSSIPEEVVAGEVSKIKEAIEKNGGIIKSDEYPKLRTLAYEMRKAVGGHNYKKYNTAYFGWMRFETEGSSLAEIKKTIDSNDQILRHILVHVPKDEEVILPKSADSSPARVSPKKEVKADAKPISEADLDKTIQELVIE